MKQSSTRLSTSQQKKINNLMSPVSSSTQFKQTSKTPLSQMIFSSKGKLSSSNFFNTLTPQNQISPTNQNQTKGFHFHKRSQVDLSNLTKLIKQQRNEMSNTSNNHNQQQMQQLMNKAKEITSQFKQNHFIGQSMPLTAAHSRNESTQNPQHKKKLLSEPKDHKSFNSHRQFTPFINYSNIKSLISRKQSVLTEQSDLNVHKKSFNFCYVIGIGGFGKVWKIEHKKTNQVFAMKEMSKALVITKKSVNSVMNEKSLLSQLKQQFLVNIYYAFQDRENLYLVMDYMPGGDLRYHIGRQRRFTEEQTKFFVACIFVGLDYIHGNNIIHRDIKPENLVLDEKGYVRITDLGIARVQKPENSSDTSGTPGYMGMEESPEVMCRQNHTAAVDYYALGVIAYEFMLGRRPYLGRSRQEIRDQVLAKQVQVRKNEIPEGWSYEAVDFINGLIQRKANNRLGNNGGDEIRRHDWFKGFEWDKLIEKQMKSPFKPNINEDNFDQKQIIIEDEENAELIQQNMMLLKDNSIQDLFAGYEYNGAIQHSSTTDQSSNSSSIKHSRTQISQNQFIN